MNVQSYELTIDGPLLRRQRQMLVAREADLCDTEKLSALPNELAAIRGLIELTDAIPIRHRQVRHRFCSCQKIRTP